eukprot:scaffold2931_cov204-Alexandrium_tamarense.AAC.5
MESSPAQPRHSSANCTPSHTQRLQRKPSRIPTNRKRTLPPSQDRLVLVFITASAIFAIVSISPFLFGHFPTHGEGTTDWFHKHNDGRGGVLEGNLAGHKTLLTWRYWKGQMQQKSDVQHNIVNVSDGSSLSLARGRSGLPMSQTPALVGAKHGTIQCPSSDGSGNIIYMNELAYWNDPQGDVDVNFVSPFAPPKDTQQKRYVTFEPDRGGWNNIRMSMEIIFVFAAATGRTLVLPPDTPFYLLGKEAEGKSTRHHGFADFLNFEHEGLKRNVEMITMEEFLRREGGVKGSSEGKLFMLPSGADGKKIVKSAKQCYYIAKSSTPCELLYSFLGSVGHVPELQAGRDCLIFDKQAMYAKETTSDEDIFIALPSDKRQRITEFCDNRNPIFFGSDLDSAPLDAAKQASSSEEYNAPGFSALHVRRGDFQYKKVKISAVDWLNITSDILHPGEVVYVATDEKDRSFFEPMQKQYNLRFLDEFSEAAGLYELDPNFAGMIDTIVASRGRVFVGTWFSTFTGYIVSNLICGRQTC